MDNYNNGPIYNNGNAIKNNKKSKYLLLIIIPFLIVGIMLFLGFKFFSGVFGTINNIFDTSTNIAENSGNSVLDKFTEALEENNVISDFDKEMFNSDFERYAGTNSKFILSSLLDKVVLNNKKNKDRILIIKYNDQEIVSENDIVKFKHSLNEDKDYEVSIDYNDNKLVNKITIYDIK